MPAPQLIQARPVPRPSLWIWAGVVAAFAVLLGYDIITNPNYRWNVVAQYIFDAKVLSAVGGTLLLTVGAMVIGIVLAVTTAVMRMSTNPVLKGVAWAYIFFFRGTPIYTQLVFWGLVPVLWPRLAVGDFFAVNTNDLYNAVLFATLGLGLNEGAYLSEIVRSGLNSVDKGQWEAATALGLDRRTTLWRIIIPQAMRVIVPPTGNETISMLKTTSLVLAVPVSIELQFVTNAIGNRAFLPIPLLIVAALWYLIITSILMVGQARLEAYYGRGFDGNDVPRPIKGMSQRQQAILTAGTAPSDPTREVTP